MTLGPHPKFGVRLNLKKDKDCQVASFLNVRDLHNHTSNSILNTHI